MNGPEQPDSQDSGLPYNPASDLVREADRPLIDAEREANKASWQKVADEANELRPIVDKVLKRDIITSPAVMHDEALKINQEVDKSVAKREEFDRRSALNVAQGEEPWPEEQAWGGKTPQEAYERLEKEEKEKAGLHQFYSEDRLFTVEKNPVWAGRKLREREEKIGPITDRVTQLLQGGDIVGADEALSAIEEVYFVDHKFLTVREHIEPALRQAMAGIFSSNDSGKLGELLDTRFLGRFIGENITQDAGITPEQRHTEEMVDVITGRVRDAVVELAPILWDHPNGRYPERELEERVDLLRRVGVMTTEEMRNDSSVSHAVTKVLAEKLVLNVSRGGRLYFPHEGWKLEELGLVDRERFIRDDRVKRAAILALAEVSSEVDEQAEAALETVMIRREELPQDGTRPIRTRTAILESLVAQAKEIKDLPSTMDLSTEQLSETLASGQTVTLEYDVLSQDFAGRLERNYELKANTLETLTELINGRIGLESEDTTINNAVVKLADGRQITIDKLMGLSE